MASWRYLFFTLLGNRFVGELPLTNVDLERKMAAAGPGNFTADLVLTDERVQRTNWREAAYPRYCVCCSELDGELFSAHIVWDTTYEVASGILHLAGAELWSYFHHRIITYDRQYGGWDQIDIVRDLLRQEFREPNGDIGVAVDPVGTRPLSGITRPLVTYAAIEGKDLAAAVEEQASPIDGFDFDVQVSYNADHVPQRRFVTGFPRLGTDSTSLAFRMPGNITADLRWPQVGSASVSRAIAIGASGLRQDWADPEQLEIGCALLEAVTSHSSVTDGNVLLALAKSDLARQRWPAEPVKTPAITRPSLPRSWGRSTRPASTPVIPVRLDQVNLGLLAASVGSTVQVNIEEPGYFAGPWDSPDGLDHRVADLYRLVGVHVVPASQKVELELNSLDGVDARVAAVS